MLYRGLRRSGTYQPSGRWRRLALQVVGANAVMAAFLWWASGDWASWTAMPVFERVLRMGACVAAGAVLYFAMLGLLGARPSDFRGAKSR
jgi:putative peptidoglycan lipid II flippase